LSGYIFFAGFAPSLRALRETTIIKVSRKDPKVYHARLLDGQANRKESF